MKSLFGYLSFFMLLLCMCTNIRHVFGTDELGEALIAISNAQRLRNENTAKLSQVQTAAQQAALNLANAQAQLQAASQGNIGETQEQVQQTYQNALISVQNAANAKRDADAAVQAALASKINLDNQITQLNTQLAERQSAADQATQNFALAQAAAEKAAAEEARLQLVLDTVSQEEERIFQSQASALASAQSKFNAAEQEKQAREASLKAQIDALTQQQSTSRDQLNTLTAQLDEIKKKAKEKEDALQQQIGVLVAQLAAVNQVTQIMGAFDIVEATLDGARKKVLDIEHSVDTVIKAHGIMSAA